MVNKSIVQHSLKDEFSWYIRKDYVRFCYDDTLIMKSQGLNIAGVYFSHTFHAHSNSVRELYSTQSLREPGCWKFHHLVATPSRRCGLLSCQGKRREEHGKLTPVLYFGLEVTQFISTYGPLTIHHYMSHLPNCTGIRRWTLPMLLAGGREENIVYLKNIIKTPA